jgi:hypothetical protein
LATLYYFAFFWLIMPIVGLIEVPDRLPDSIAQSVLAGSTEAKIHPARSFPAKRAVGLATSAVTRLAPIRESTKPSRRRP